MSFSVAKPFYRIVYMYACVCTSYNSFESKWNFTKTIGLKLQVTRQMPTLNRFLAGVEGGRNILVDKEKLDIIVNNWDPLFTQRSRAGLPDFS
jgi:hypothetical protein